MNKALLILIFIYSILLGLSHTQPSPKEIGPPSDQLRTIHYDQDLTLPVMGRSIDDFRVSSLLLTSDIEGNIHALNRETGELIWTLLGQKPLVQTSTSLNQSLKTQEDDITWIVEPYNDGSLYFFNKEFGLTKLSTSIKDLVLQSPFALNGDDKIYTGVRKTSLYKVNAKTGEIIGSFGLNDDDDPFTSNDIDVEEDDDDDIMNDQNAAAAPTVILLGKTVYELTIYSQNSSMWNVTYTSWGPNNLDIDLISQNHDSMDGVYIAPFHDSSLLAIDSNLKTAKWISNLPSVAINVFDIFQDSKTANYLLLPHPLHPQTSSSTTTTTHKKLQDEQEEDTFIDRTKEGSWFAMSDSNYPSLVKSAPVAKYCLNDKWRSSKIFTDDELFHKSISGVHKNFAGQNSLQLRRRDNLIPSAVGVGHGHHGQNQNQNKQISHEKSWLSLPTADILSIDPPDNNHYSFKRVLFRIFENTITTIFFTMMIIGLSRLGILPPITQMLSKLGFFKRTHHAVELVDQLLKNDESNLEKSINLIKRERLNLDKDLVDNKIDNIEENDKFTKKVTILEPPPSSSASATIDEDESSQQQNVPQKKARKRGTRGGKRNKKNKESHAESPDETEITATAAPPALPTTTDVVVSTPTAKNNLILSDVVLGYGSHGTVVYKGTFENRPVAIKRMLIDFYDVASHEVNLLQESDDHPNVIRYYCSQENDRFLYIALELCSATLEDVLDKPQQYVELSSRMDNVDVLYQMIKGLHHLHSLKIVHRDIKPQNILVVPPKKLIHDNKSDSSPIRILISDFGLCKKLEADQSSFRATTAHAAGTSGWRAPELLIDENDSINNFINGGDNNNNKTTTTTTTTTSDAVAAAEVCSISEPLVFDSISNRRLTRAIDIFSMGCVFYYVLTNGQHPFGDRYLREGNIIKGEYNLDMLDITPYAYESRDLITMMISRNPMARPDTNIILKHPFFWNVDKKLDFLLRVSDRFEIETRDPPSELLQSLESVALQICGVKGWYAKFDNEFLDNLGKYRKYDSMKLIDLLRAIRNKYHHFNDLNESLLKKMSPLPAGFYHYYSSKFPNLLMEIYHVIANLDLKNEDAFKCFF